MKSLPIDERGRKFMLKFLEPEKTLSGKILLDHPTWKVRTVVPDSTTPERAYDFETGGLCGMNDSREWLFNALRHVRRIASVEAILVEDIWAEPKDVYREHDVRLEPLWFDVSQFYVIDSSDLELTLLNAFLNAPLSFYNAVVGVSSTINFLNADSVRKNAKFIFITAYDEESFIFSGEPELLDSREWQ